MMAGGGDNGHRSKHRGQPCAGCGQPMRLSYDNKDDYPDHQIHQRKGWCQNCIRFGPKKPGQPEPRPQWQKTNTIEVHGLDSDDPTERNNAINLLAFQLRRRKRNAPVAGLNLPGDDDLDPVGRPKR